jgi:hypothetical protein
MIWAHKGHTLYFYPDHFTREECHDATDEINGKFPVGSGIDVSYKEFDVPEGQQFDVTGVMHWAWAGKNMYFFPDNYTPDQCNDAAAAFSEVFPPWYGIDVYNKIADNYIVALQAGEEISASGVMHWSWAGSAFYFFSEVSNEELQTKFPSGSRIQVGYSDLVDYPRYDATLQMGLT